MKKLASKISKFAISCLATVATLLVAFLGVFSSPLMNVAKVMAEELRTGSSATLKLKSLKTKVNLGEDIVIPQGEAEGSTVNVVVKDPKGATIFESAGRDHNYTKMETGDGSTIYTISDTLRVTETGDTYSFKAGKTGTYKVQYFVSENGDKVALKTQEFQIQVTGTKAELSFESNTQYIIPSVINSNNTVVLPNPVVTESDGSTVSEEEVLTNLTIEIQNTVTKDVYSALNGAFEKNGATISETDSIIKKDGDNSNYHYYFTPETDECSYIVTYSYKAENELITTYEPFEIEYDKNFKSEDIKLGYNFTKSEDNGLSSIPSSFELGTEIILPIASFYDENDEDLEIKGQTIVNVIFTPNDANKTSYAEKYADKKIAGTDNYIVSENSNKFTPIFPSSEGTYTITYDLYSYYTLDANSKKADGEEKKSDKHLIYKVTDAKDSTAPTTYVVDAYSFDETTGVATDFEIKDVSYKIPTKVKTGTTVNFPAIYATDNLSSFNDMKDTFHRVIVPEKDSNVTLENTIKTGEEKYKFNEEASYKFETAGTYTIRYEATDKAGKYNYTGTTFTIVVEDDFEDAVAPRITMSSIQSTAKAGDTVEFKKPTVIDYASNKSTETEIDDKNLEVYYFYYNTNDISDDEGALQTALKNYQENKTSETLHLISEKEGDSSKLSFVVPNDVAESAQFKVVCVAFDDSYYATNGSTGMSYVVREIEILNIESDTECATFESFGDYGSYEVELKRVTNEANGKDDPNEQLGQDEQITLPTMVAFDNGENTQYLESFVDVFDKDGNKVSVTGAKYTIEGDRLSIQNAKFVATKAGHYTIVYTLEDVGGNYTIKSYVIKVEDTKAPTIELDGTLSSVEVGNKVSIPSIIVKDDGEVITPSVLKIEFGDNCPSYKWNKGTKEFTALEAGTFTYKYIVEDGAGNKAETGYYSFEAKDTEKPVITLDYELQNNKSFKLEKTDPEQSDYDAITLPGFTAEDVLNGIRETSVTVKSPKNKDIKTTENADGTYSFVPTIDGTYTVTYSATDNANNTTTIVRTIKVGDTTAPTLAFADSENFGKKSDIKVSGSSVIKIDLSKVDISDAGETKTAKELSSSYTTSGSKRFTITVTGPDGSTITANDGTSDGIYEYSVSSSGKYTITYTARDYAGNEKIIKEYVTAYSDDNQSVVTTETWSIILIVISLAILAGVVIYFIKTRDKKTTGKPKMILDKKDDDKKED